MISTPHARAADPLLDEVAAALLALPLRPEALVNLADAAGAPVAEGTEAREIVETAARLEGALPRLVILAARACPESAPELEALARRCAEPAPRDGARAAVDRSSLALGHAWSRSQSPWLWDWRRAQADLDAARLDLATLADDPDLPSLQRWADEIDATLSTVPARLARLPGARLAAALQGQPRLSTAVYTTGQLVARLPRLWPLFLLIAALWIMLGAAPPGDGGVVPAPTGLMLGKSNSDVGDPAPNLLRPVLLPPVLSQPTEAPADTPPPRRRSRDRPDPVASPSPMHIEEAVEPVPSSDGPATPQALNAGSGAGGDAVLTLDPGDGTGRGGSVTGSGSIRHTALASVAPMPFMGVNNLPVPVEAPLGGEVWVAQTEVTEDQWMALMGLDFAVLTGRSDRPAEHMTWCGALDFANRLSKAERLDPVYDVPRGCDRGARPRWRPDANGYRLPTEAEWEAMVGSAPGWGVDARSAVRARAADVLGLYGVEGNAAEFVWAGDGVPVLRHRSCAVAAVEDQASWPEGEPLLCRFEVPPGERVLGGGLRLVRNAPGRQG